MLPEDRLLDNIRCHVNSVTALTGGGDTVGAAVHLHCGIALQGLDETEQRFKQKMHSLNCAHKTVAHLIQELQKVIVWLLSV